MLMYTQDSFVLSGPLLLKGQKQSLIHNLEDRGTLDFLYQEERDLQDHKVKFTKESMNFSTILVMSLI